MSGLRTVVVHTADAGPELLLRIRTMMVEAFDGDVAEADWSHCLGGLHAVALDGEEVLGHAALVQRHLLHAGRTLRCGYVEGVAVEATARRRGVGGLVMAPLERAVEAAYDVGALAATEEAVPFYTARGWTPWAGRAFALTPDGVVRTPDEEDALFVRGPGLDRHGDLTCDWRDGDLW